MNKSADGVSLIICCYNSTNRLYPTLKHIALQKLSAPVSYEIILIDNASTDNTAQIAKEIWSKLNSDIPFRIIDEPKQGLIYARQKGFTEAKYEFVSFIDDDNWISENWVENVYEIMSSNHEAGVCGGFIRPEFEKAPPVWFDEVKSAYAVGEQYHQNGFLEFSKRNYLWGAGFTIRKTAYNKLMHSGYKSLLTGRKGDSLSAGEDSELCLAIQLAGYKLFYSDTLRLKHFILVNRLTLNYCKKINTGFGSASVSTDALEYYTKLDTGKKNTFGIWLWNIGSCIKIIIISFFRPQKINVIMHRAYFTGRIKVLIQTGHKQYQKIYDCVLNLKRNLSANVY